MTVPWKSAYGAVLLSVERLWLKDAATDIAKRFSQPTIVNIGVFEFASMYCLRAGAPAARLIGVDIEYPKRPHAELKAELITGDSRKCHTRVKAPIHLLFVDGDHSYATVKADIANWTPKIAPEGIVVFHDYAPTKKHLLKWKLHGVRQAIDEWARTSGWKRIPAPGSLAAFRRPE